MQGDAGPGARSWEGVGWEARASGLGRARLGKRVTRGMAGPGLSCFFVFCYTNRTASSMIAYTLDALPQASPLTASPTPRPSVASTPTPPAYSRGLRIGEKTLLGTWTESMINSNISPWLNDSWFAHTSRLALSFLLAVPGADLVSLPTHSPLPPRPLPSPPWGLTTCSPDLSFITNLTKLLCLHRRPRSALPAPAYAL